MEYIIVEKGETIHSIAKVFNVKEYKLLIYNDLINPILLEEGQYLFLSKKKSKGVTSEYIVQKGDTMYQIAQKQGIRIHKLYQLNQMKYGEEPQIYRVLNLQ